MTTPDTEERIAEIRKGNGKPYMGEVFWLCDEVERLLDENVILSRNIGPMFEKNQEIVQQRDALLAACVVSVIQAREGRDRRSGRPQSFRRIVELLEAAIAQVRQESTQPQRSRTGASNDD